MAMKLQKTEDGRYHLDLCGFVCPHPQIHTKKSFEQMESGDILELVFDNPSSGEPIIHMCGQSGHEILEKKEENGKLIYII